MPNFKHKTNKKIIMDEKSITTLDSKHRDIENGFAKEKEETLPELRAKKRYFQKLASDTSISIEQKIEIQDTLRDVTSQINDIKKNNKHYYLNNNQYIFDYFENKKEISNNNNKTKLLNSFFKINSDEDHEAITQNKDSIQKYLSNLDESFIDISKFIVETDICQSCKKGELIPIDHEGIMVCNHCHKHIQYLVENEKPSYKEPPKEACFMRIKELIIFAKYWLSFKQRKLRKFRKKCWKILRIRFAKKELI